MLTEQERRLLLHHGDERELRAAADARRASREGILRGMYLLERAARPARRRACSCSAAARSCARCCAAAELLRNDCGVEADVWSVTSFNELRRDGLDARALEPAAPGRGAARARWSQQRARGAASGPVDRRDRLHEGATPTRSGAFVPGRYDVLGTDGFGRCDTRERLRHFFEVDRYYVAVAALKALARRRRAAAGDGGAPRSRSTGSTPASPSPRGRELMGTTAEGPAPRHRRLRRRRRDRGARRARRSASTPSSR